MKNRHAGAQQVARQSRAGRSCRHITQRVVWNFRAQLGADDRGGLVGVTELDAKALVLGVADRSDTPPCLEPCGIALWPGRPQIGEVDGGNLGAHLAVTLGGFAVAPADRSALCVVRGQQTRSPEAVQHGGELPAEVASIANAGIHAVAAGREVLVCGIAGQEHPSRPIALGHQQMRRPSICYQDFVIKVASCELPQQHMWVHGLWRDILRPARLQGPDVAIVLRYEASRRRLIMPGDAPALQQVASRRSKVRHEPLHDAGLTVEADTETVAHSAGAAVAADEILAADLLGLTVGRANRRGHRLLVLRQILQSDGPSRIYPLVLYRAL